MNVKEYISSGILEQYVLDKLSAVERTEVQAMAVQHPEVQAEIDLIETTLEHYAQLHGIAPPNGTLLSIWNKINTSKAVGTNSWKVASYLLGALLLLTAFGAYNFYQNGNDLAETNQELSSQLAAKNAACDSLRQDYVSLNNQVALLRDTNYVSVKMSATGFIPGVIAKVLHSSKEKATYIDVLHLPPPPSDKDYQLWAILDGQPQPVDMGIIPLAANGQIELKSVPYFENVKVFAVTLENKGGVPSPTLDAMVMAGEV